MRPPGGTSSLTSFNTVMGSLTSVKVLVSPLAASTWSRNVSLIAQCLRRLDSRCTPSRIKRGQEGQQQGQTADVSHIGPMQLTLELANVIHVSREQVGMQNLLHQRHDVHHVDGEQNTEN